MMATSGSICPAGPARKPIKPSAGAATRPVTSPRVGCIFAPGIGGSEHPRPKVAGSYAVATPFAIGARWIGTAMEDDIAASLRRIAQALERIAPSPVAAPSFLEARL